MVRPVLILLSFLALPLLPVRAQTGEEVMRSFQDFMSTYDPSKPQTYTPGSGAYGRGNDLLNFFIQAYGLARQFFRGLPPIYLQGVSDMGEIRNKILDLNNREAFLLGRKGILPQGFIDILRERLFIPDIRSQFKLYWALPKGEVEEFVSWNKGPGFKGEIVFVPWGADETTKKQGAIEDLNLGFFMLENDIYLFSRSGNFYRIDPGPAKAFIPWLRLAINQLEQAKRNDPEK